jgi:hypothetical protein
MKLRRSLFIALSALIVLGSSFTLSAIELDNLFDLTTGYQRHNFHTAIALFEPEGASLGEDHLVVRNLHVWTAGVEGRLCMPHCEQLYSRFNADYGWVISPGKYWEVYSVAEGKSESFGKAKSGSTIDAELGIGYMFNLKEVGVAPIAGWSYNEQRMKMGHVIRDGVRQDNLESLKSSYQWNGPWVGIDLFYDTLFTCYGNLSLEGGYEYHWARWNSRWKLKGADRWSWTGGLPLHPLELCQLLEHGTALQIPVLESTYRPSSS